MLAFVMPYRGLALLVLACWIMMIELWRRGHNPERWMLAAAVTVLSLFALNVARGLHGGTRP
jgi:hypothetical protein